LWLVPKIGGLMHHFQFSWNTCLLSVCLSARFFKRLQMDFHKIWRRGLDHYWKYIYEIYPVIYAARVQNLEACMASEGEGRASGLGIKGQSPWSCGIFWYFANFSIAVRKSTLRKLLQNHPIKSAEPAAAEKFLNYFAIILASTLETVEETTVPICFHVDTSVANKSVKTEYVNIGRSDP